MKLGVALALVSSAVAASSAASAQYELVSRGPVVGAAIGMSRAGYTLMFDVGGETAGIHACACRRFLFSWDLLLAGRGGELANAEPYVKLWGVRGAAFFEPAYRLRDARWSPVVSTRIASSASVLFHPGMSLDELRTLNDVDGVGGVTMRGLVRAGGGLSFLDDDRSLLLQGFVQELLQTAGVNAKSKAFTQVGFSVRWDARDWLSLGVEGAWGQSALREDAALNRTDRTTRMGLAGNVRTIFGNGMWLGLATSLQRDTDHVVWRENGTTFDTGDPADFTLGLTFGWSPWRRR